MCRLYGFLANEETKVECSLVLAQNALMIQSRSDQSGRAHIDGWGIAFYHDSHPELERRATAAYEDLHFSRTAERIFTQAVVAHVRLATVGTPTVVNSHPFTLGPWTFAHNGTVRGFDELRETMLAQTDPWLLAHRLGATDSEHAFHWLLTRMKAAGISYLEPCRDVNALRDVITEAVRRLSEWCAEVDREEPAKLNFVITDGHVLVATRWNNSLYWVCREGIHDCEICGIPHVHHQSGTTYRAIVVASEPLTHEAWREVPNFSVLTVSEQIEAEMRPIVALSNEPSSRTPLPKEIARA